MIAKVGASRDETKTQAKSAQHATELPDGAQQAPVTNHETRAIKTLDEQYHELIQRMQCEALDENKDGPSRVRAERAAQLC